MEKGIRLAMIGCGRRAPAYPKSVRAIAGVKIVALCDLVAQRVKVIKGLCGDESIREYTDYKKMLQDGGFDAVLVVTEPEYQAPLSVDVMEAGYDVFSEVPVSYSIEECWELVITVERTGKLYYLGEQVRHTPLIRHWTDLVREGRLGTILFAEGHYIHGASYERFWRHSETGELLNWEQAKNTKKRVKSRRWSMTHPILYGPHELSPLLKILDDRIASVFCYSSGSPNKRMREVPFPCQFEEFPVPDMEVALMCTEKGTIIRFAADFSTPVSSNHWYHLLGTKGEVETRRGVDEPGYSYYYPVPVMGEGIYCTPRKKEPWFFSHGEPPVEIANKLGIQLSLEERATHHGGTDFYPLKDFINCLRNGTKPDIDVYQAVDTAVPCILAANSADLNGEKKIVPDFRPNKTRNPGEMPKSGSGLL